MILEPVPGNVAGNTCVEVLDGHRTEEAKGSGSNISEKSEVPVPRRTREDSSKERQLAPLSAWRLTNDK